MTTVPNTRMPSQFDREFEIVTEIIPAHSDDILTIVRDWMQHRVSNERLHERLHEIDHQIHTEYVDLEIRGELNQERK